MKTSVVIPVYDGIKFLRQNLARVVDLGCDEVVVVDDASLDNSAGFVTKKFPRVKLVRHNRNLRFPLTVNDGFRAATGEVVFLLNQDVRPRPDLVERTLPHFKDPRLFAVTFNESDRSWAEGGWVGGMLEFKNGVLDDQIHVSLWASGGSAAFRKSYWDLLGGFDPVFTPGYFEDLDLGLRATRAGYQIIWDPAARVEHIAEATFSQTFTSGELARIKERNYLLACWKSLPPGSLWRHLVALTTRVFWHPGYIVVILQALAKWPYAQKTHP